MIPKFIKINDLTNQCSQYAIYHNQIYKVKEESGEYYLLENKDSPQPEYLKDETFVRKIFCRNLNPLEYQLNLTKQRINK